MIYTLIKKDKDSNIVDIFSFDSVKDFSESWSSTVTTQTVEYGFNITDNINIEAPTYSINGVVSSYSLFDDSGELTWDGESFTSATPKDGFYHLKARNRLIAIVKARSMLSILESSVNSFSDDIATKDSQLRSGHIREIPNCVITKLEISFPSNSSDVIYVNIQIQKIDVAYVAVASLTESEMLPELQPLAVNSQTVSNNASTTTDGTSSSEKDGDVTKMLKDAEKDAKKQSSSGLDWSSEYQKKQSEAKTYKDELAAVKAAREAERIHGGQWTVDQVGGQWKVTRWGY